MTTSQPAKVNGEQSQNLIKNGYLFASELRDKAGLPPESSCPVETKFMFEDALIVRGADGIDFFYDEDVIERAGAMPHAVGDALVGAQAVHNLDGEAHKVRKQEMAHMAYDDDRVAQFAPIIAEEVDRIVESWKGAQGNVHHDMSLAYGRAALRWAGVDLPQDEADEVVERMTTLLDTFGKPAGTPTAFWQRKKLNDWSEKLITSVRAGETQAPADSVLEHMANLKDEQGELVDDLTAGVELQNLTRPVVAAGIFATFAAIALVENPDWRVRVHEAVEKHDGLPSEVREAIAFSQEVRRFYPFVPMFPAKAKKDTEFKGCPVHEGERVILDFIGTLHSPEEWENPGTFDPERFMQFANQSEAESIKAFIPQGGADVRTGHRCPGEKLAVTALSTTVAAMSRPEVQISSDKADTTYPMDTMLTRPKTGVRVTVK